MSDWRSEGKCREVDPELFFPVGTGKISRKQIRSARFICSGCPVRQACLDYALGRKQLHGVWGGTTEHQRQEMRRKARETSTVPESPAAA